MTDLTLFVGLDVHKKTISVAPVGAAASATVRFYGTIANTPDTLRGLSKTLSKDGEALHFCYEAGPCGYGVQRQLTRLGHRCDVVAPASTCRCCLATRALPPDRAPGFAPS